MATFPFVNRLYQFCYSRIPMFTYESFSVKFGAAGAVASTSGSQLASCTKLATGFYKLKLSANYNKFINMHNTILMAPTGSPVADGSFATGTPYQITVVGTTNWAAIGLDSGLTPTIGQSFVATGAGGAGTGTATALTSGGVEIINVFPDPNTMSAASPQGAVINIAIYNAVSGALSDPANGAEVRFSLMCNNSTAQPPE